MFPVLYLIEILHQTTTADPSRARTLLLYLIEILHQTTTGPLRKVRRLSLYLIEILHQTTTCNCTTLKCERVVSYRNSTSNHNLHTS